MKKICKILFLTLILALTVCVRSYATTDDGSSTDPSSSESTEENTNTDSDGSNVTEPDTNPDEGDVTDPDTNPDGGDVTDPDANPDEGDVTDPDANPDDNKDNEPTGTYSAQDEKSNIKISASTDVVPNGTTLKVDVITSGDTFDAIGIALGDVKFIVFDITLLDSNNTAIQPNNGTVKISIPIPEGYDKSNLVAYRFAADGTKEKEYTVTIEGNYAVIEADHFSDYVLAEKVATTDGTVDNATSDKTLDNEPKTGINNPVAFVVSVLVIACLGLAICIKKMSK